VPAREFPLAEEDTAPTVPDVTEYVKALPDTGSVGIVCKYGPLKLDAVIVAEVPAEFNPVAGAVVAAKADKLAG